LMLMDSSTPSVLQEAFSWLGIDIMSEMTYITIK